MSERPDLEQELRQLSARLEWPVEADLSHAVGRRLRQRGSTRVRPGFAWRAPRLAGAAAALAVVASLVLVVVPDTRSALAGWLGLGGEHIVVSKAPTTLVPLTIPPGPPDLGLGPPVSLAQARAAVGINVLVPALAGLSRPDEVHVVHPPAGGEVALLYRAHPGMPAAGTTGVGMLITLFRGSIEPAFFAKVLGPDTRLTQVQVAGVAGYWIEGAPHQFFYTDEHGRVQSESIRLAANVLLWESGGLTLRIESVLPEATAVRIADSMR